MSLSDFRRAGNGRVLFSAFLYFDVSFMVWVLIGALATFVADDLGLTASQKGLMTAVPLLAGSAFRLILGPLSDHIGCRRTGLIGLVLTMAPLLVGWQFANSLPAVVLVGLMLGVAGASFAVALPLASRWYPKEHQGLAMGIAGAGNSGTVLAAVFAPRLAEHFGWQAVFGMAMVPVAVTALVFFLLAKDSPAHVRPASLAAYAGGLRRRETVWLSLLYAVTFGGFVGLASYLGIFFRDQYGVAKVTAGDLTAVCVVAGSFLRPVGGGLSDRFGGLRVLTLLFAVASCLLLAVATLPPLWLSVPLIFALMGVLGMGNGAIFQVIPQLFTREIGVITGIVGAAGGLGGFYLPTTLGYLKESTGSFGPGFVAFAGATLLGIAVIAFANRRLALRAELPATEGAA